MVLVGEPYSIRVQRSKVDEIIAAFASQRETNPDVDLQQLRGPYISVFDVAGTSPSQLFDPVLGSVRVPSAQSVSRILSDFFSYRRDSYRDGQRYGRGYSYYCCDDLTNGAATISLLSCDIVEGIRVIGQVDRSRLNFEEYLFYLAILDHIKNGFLQLHHIYSSAYLQELSGKAGVGQPVSNPLQQAAIDYTRVYYYALTGAPIELEGLFGENGTERAVPLFAEIDSIIARINPEIIPWFFEGPWLDHPLYIWLQALRYANIYPATDTILAMPSGGAHLAIVLQLALETLGTRANIAFLHYSPRTSLRLFRNNTSSEWLQQHLQSLDLAGKHILIGDDSILNGLSIQELTQALALHRPASIHAAIARVNVAGMRKWAAADTIEELEQALAIQQAAIQQNDVPDRPEFPKADTAEVFIANPQNPDLKVIGLTKQGNLEEQYRRMIVQIYPFRKVAEITEANRLLSMSQSLAAQIGVLLVKPDAVEYGIAEELIYAAQSRLIEDNIELTGVAALTIPGDVGRKLYPTLHPDNLVYLMENYLTKGVSVIAVFCGDGAVNATNRLRQIEGKPIWNYSARELVTMPFGLQDSLRGIIPVPGTGESYRRGILRLLHDRLGLTTTYEDWDDYGAVNQSLVHVAEDAREVCGLLSILPLDVLRDALGDLYHLYELVSSYYQLPERPAEPSSCLNDAASYNSLNKTLSIH